MIDYSHFMFKFLYLIFFLFSLSGCQKYGLLLHQQKMDVNYFASTHVNTPDFRRECPPNGKMVVAEWWIPQRLLDYEPVLRIHMLFHDFTEKCVEYPVTATVGYETYFLIDEEFEETGGILSYRGEIISCDGEIFRCWEHQLWVQLIAFEEDNAAALMSSAKEEKSRQESVIEIPACKSLN